MASVPVRWTIRPFLERYDLTPYRLMKETGLAQGTIYRLVRGETNTLNVETLDRVMTALRRLTGEDVQISHLLVYEEPDQ